MQKISLIIITFGRLAKLKRCLYSVYQSEMSEDYELIIILNGSDKDTLEFLNEFKKEHPDLKFFVIERTGNGSARNIALRYALGDIFYFLDDDVIVEKKTIYKLREKLKEYENIDIIGGPNLTPPGSNFFQRCSGYVLSSIFGADGVRYRFIISSGDKLVDDKSLILCNLALRKKVFEQEEILFNEDVVCNEENLLLHELKSKGYEMLYSPEILVYHDRRRSLPRFTAQFFKYGRGRGQMTRYLPGSLSLSFIIPSGFVLYLVSLLFIHYFIYLLPLIVYIVLDLSFSFHISIREKNILILPLLFFLFPAGHIAYGLGVLYGLIR